MVKQYHLSHLLFTCVFAAISGFAFAQKDTTKKQTVEITSAYKPVLRNAVKINFSGTQIAADTSRIVQPYLVPDQNLFYSYRPVTLKPLALQQDTNLYLGTRNFVKAGFGNNTTPFIRVGLGIGNGKTGLVNIYADYVSSIGKIRHQDYSQMNIKAAGSYFMPKHELYGSAGLSMNNYYLYGYDHSVHEFTSSQVRQQFRDVIFTGGIRNTQENALRVNYDPHFMISLFNYEKKLTENSVVFNVPVEKRFGDAFVLKGEAIADLTNYPDKLTFPGNSSSYNNVVQLTPSLEFKLKQVRVKGGMSAVWDNGSFNWLPDINVRFRMENKLFEIQAGWVGRIIKNTFRNLSAVNPYLISSASPLNTKEIEYYGGVRANIGKHFSFNGKVGWVEFDNLPFFINDTTANGKGFITSNENKAHDLRIHADINYINQDKFTLTGGININAYGGLNDNKKAWGALPMEFTGSLRWWAFKHLLLKGDFYLFGGSHYIAPGSSFYTSSGGSDLSAGAEYAFNKKFSVWMDVNNIFNDKYERWHNYEVYGINLLTGIIIHF
jgi:hypothetical protein